MHQKKTELEKAVGQAVRAVSKGQVIPKQNPLLGSPLVAQYLHERKLEDIPEHRQLAVEALLKRFVNAYGLEHPQARQREAHERTFEILFSALRGRPLEREIAERSRERYRSAGFKMLAKSFEQAEQELLRPAGDETGAKLALARTRAREISDYLERYPSEIDLFALSELSEAAHVIEISSYYAEAEPYFRLIIQRLLSGPPNNVILRQQATATRLLAHCYMNQDKHEPAVHHFLTLSNLATKLEDRELLTHSIHMRGVTFSMIGDAATALNAFAQAEATAPPGDNYKYRLAWIKRDQINALVKQGDFRPIDRLARETLAYRATLPEPQDYMVSLDVWARALIVQGKFAQAENVLQEARSILGNAPHRLFHTIIFTTTARLYLSWGKMNEGQLYFKKAYDLAIAHQLWHRHKRLNELRKLMGPNAN